MHSPAERRGFECRVEKGIWVVFSGIPFVPASGYASGMDWGLVLTLLELAALVAVDIYLVVYLWRGAPYLPTKRQAVERMMGLADIRQGVKAADLGSGDGRIVIALAKAGAEAHGYEVNGVLAQVSKKKIARAGVGCCAFIHHQDFWDADLKEFDVVTVFGMTHIMKRLGHKLEAELPAGARVVSNGFRIPGWKPAQTDGNLILYRMPARVDRPEKPG